MKRIINILLAVLLVSLLCGCSSSKEETSNGELQIFLPGEYISEKVIKGFEDEYGVKCNITVFESNESMYTKLLSGTSYDIVIPSDYMIERLIKEKMVQKLDKSKLECLDELYDGVKNLDFDPNNDYAIPYFWGNTGIVYDSTLIDSADVEAQGWEVLKNTKYAGNIYMYDSIRDMFMIAEKSLGYSMNTSDENEINDAFNWLCDIADTMDPAYAADECIDGLAYGEKAMGFMYSGDAAYILSENEDMRYYCPDGANYWVDCMLILNNAKNVENAYKFINYITSYDAAYENSSFVGYASVNGEVLNDLSAPGADYDGNEAYIPRIKTANDETFHNDEETLKVLSELWIKVKNR